MSKTGVLSGLRVVEVSAFVAVPFGGLMLAQLGAEVIRIDPLGGGLDFGRWPISEDGVSLYWAGLNKGKRSVCINVQSEAGRDLVRKLVTAPGQSGGILVTNLSPPWLDYEEMRTLRDDLIMIVLQGNPNGSAAVDYTVNAAAGFPLVTGQDGPVNHVLPAWDLLAGSMVSTAVLAAELRRRETGQGDLVKLSLADVAFTTVGHLGHVAEVVVSDTDRAGYGNFLYGTFGKDFPTGDSGRVMVVALTPRQWSALVSATETEAEMADLARSGGWDLADEGDRFKARQGIAEVLGPWFEKRALSEVAAKLEAHKVVWGPYQSFRQLHETDPRVDPQHNPVWSNVDQPGIGVFPAPGSPIRFTTGHTPPVSPAPLLGADTEAVLGEVLSLTADQAADLRKEGVV